MTHIFLKIKVAFKDAKDRFYRIFYVKSGSYLEPFIDRVLYTLGCSMDHLYELRSNTFIPEDAFIDDLPKKSELVYDFGDNWRFEITRYKNELILNDDRQYILVDAKGREIWEDFIGYFYMFLNGELNDDNFEEIFGEYYKPSDFDLPVDIEKLNKEINNRKLSFTF